MNDQPKTAGSAERDLIESMLHRQEEVLTDLDNLFDRIDSVIDELTEQRKREAADADNFLPFGPLPPGHHPADSSGSQAATLSDLSGHQEKAA